MKQIALPNLRKGMTRATVRRWLRQPGETVRAGDTIVELELEDALIRLDAAASGVIVDMVARPGQTIDVDGLLATFEEGAVGREPQGLFAGATPPIHDGATPAEPASVAAAITAKPSPSTSPAFDLSAFTPILMPQAGNTMEEGVVLAWHVKVGDVIEAGQVICEIETDKATMEYESPEAGRLAALVAKIGDVVAVKDPIAYLGDADFPEDAIGDDAAHSAPPHGDKVANKDGRKTINAQELAELEKRVTPILMPQAGNSMEEGTVLAWLVEPGAVVAEGQPICEIETDKATMEYESPAAGRLARIIADTGATIAVKRPIAVLAESDADAQAWFAAQGETTPVAARSPALDSPQSVVNSPEKSLDSSPSKGGGTAPVASPAVADIRKPGNGRVKASPAARKLAAERGLSIESFGPGAGPYGRLLFEDVKNAKVSKSPLASTSDASVKIEPLRIGVGEAAETGGVIRRPMTKMRKAIALNLQKSKQEVPHFYVTGAIDAGMLFCFYRKQKPLTGCTVNDVVMLAVGRVMAEFPGVRSQWHGSEIVEFPTANIGVAVGVPDGLVVPVIVGVERLSLVKLAAETKRVVEKARNGQIENMGKGNFTISNLGMFGVENFSAIINPPESGILAVSAVREEIIVKNGAMRPGRKMSMTLSADHRVVDGLLAAQFMKRLCEVLEYPEILED